MNTGNLYAQLKAAFPADDGATCLELPDGRTISYADMDRGSSRIAGCLHGLGISPGDRVVVQVEKSPDAVLLYLACLRAGAVFVPLNTAYTPREVAYFLEDAKPKFLICRPEVEDELEPVARGAGDARLLTLGADGEGTLREQSDKASPFEAIAPVKGDELAAILYTSGTTGRSKGAMLSHDNLASNARVLHDYWGWKKGDVLIHALPIFHVHGLFVALHCAMLNGSPMFFLPRFNADTVIGLFPRATVMMGVPTFYVRLLEHPGLGPAAVEGMRLFIAGSAPLLEETFNAFEQRTGFRILERYGMTEAGMITSNPLKGDRLPGTVGYLLPGVEGRVADSDGTELPRGEPGVLEIRGPNVFRGYWGMPDKTAEEFRSDGFFVTGDIAKMATDGRISIVGRAKDLVISGGYNVYPKEIELLIDAIPGVLESAVVGLPHPDFGEAVTAVVVPDGSAPVDENSVRRALEGDLARFKQPKRVFVVDELPRNTMGKVQKNQLRVELADTYAT